MTGNLSVQILALLDPGELFFYNTIECGVLLRMAELKRRGGPSDSEIEWLKNEELIELISAETDGLFRPGYKKGHTAKVINKMIEAISIMAFFPGGVRIFGMLFENTIESR